jgi:hypothetical protein
MSPRLARLGSCPGHEAWCDSTYAFSLSTQEMGQGRAQENKIGKIKKLEIAKNKLAQIKYQQWRTKIFLYRHLTSNYHHYKVFRHGAL